MRDIFNPQIIRSYISAGWCYLKFIVSSIGSNKIAPDKGDSIFLSWRDGPINRRPHTCTILFDSVEKPQPSVYKALTHEIPRSKALTSADT